ncbi:MAG TPA: bifunctional rhamnulose-1-phosphate aldolase/short-chain dehydrogenase [Candidatus Dormibacteraeota bacterium]
MSITTRGLDRLWRAADAPDDPVEQLLYRSHLLGSDLRITNFAGGNTSAKVATPDPVTGAAREVLWVKGSGGDLGTLQRGGLALLDVARLRELERTYVDVAHEDEQATLLSECLAGAGAPPSIDTPLHALLPFAHVDHVHPDAVIALATAEGGPDLVDEVYGGAVGWLDWQRPGFDLALRLRVLVNSRPGLRGVVLGGHGLVAWAEDSRTCYETTLDLIDAAAARLETAQRGRRTFGGCRTEALDQAARRRQAVSMLPLLRGLAAHEGAVPVAAFRDDAPVLEFAGSADAARLVEAGTSCPDHFLRTKQRPLLLDLPPSAAPDLQRVTAAFDAYRERYRAYHATYAGPASPPVRNANPVVVLWPGIGMFTLAATAAEARIAGEFYVNAINVMRGAEAVGGYRGLAEAEAFNVEYWALEEAKLRRRPAPKPLAGRIALVTGAAGGIGAAIARRLAAEGAMVVAADLDQAGVDAVASELGEAGLGVPLDVTDSSSVEAAFESAVLRYGGVDIVVNNAGISLSKPLTETTLDDYERLHAVIDRGSFLVSRAFARIAERQQTGGDIVYVVSKNAIVAGPANVAYSAAKASQLHQMRVLAAELAPLGVRVNAVNPDGVVRGSKIFAGEWGDNRANVYGVERSQLGDYYAQRTLLKREILPEDVAAAVFVLMSGQLAKTTGAVIPVDGGIPAAFVR